MLRLTFFSLFGIWICIPVLSGVQVPFLSRAPHPFSSEGMMSSIDAVQGSSSPLSYEHLIGAEFLFQPTLILPDQIVFPEPVPLYGVGYANLSIVRTCESDLCEVQWNCHRFTVSNSAFGAGKIRIGNPTEGSLNITFSKQNYATTSLYFFPNMNNIDINDTKMASQFTADLKIYCTGNRSISTDLQGSHSQIPLGDERIPAVFTVKLIAEMNLESLKFPKLQFLVDDSKRSSEWITENILVNNFAKKPILLRYIGIRSEEISESLFGAAITVNTEESCFSRYPLNVCLLRGKSTRHVFTLNISSSITCGTFSGFITIFQDSILSFVPITIISSLGANSATVPLLLYRPLNISILPNYEDKSGIVHVNEESNFISEKNVTVNRRIYTINSFSQTFLLHNPNTVRFPADGFYINASEKIIIQFLNVSIRDHVPELRLYPLSYLNILISRNCEQADSPSNSQPLNARFENAYESFEFQLLFLCPGIDQNPRKTNAPQAVVSPNLNSLSSFFIRWGPKRIILPVVLFSKPIRQVVYITNVFPTAVWIALLPVDGFTADERFQFIQRAKYIRPNRRTVLGYIEFNPTCSLFLTDSTGHSVFTKFSIRQMQYHKSYLKSVDFPFNHDSLVNGSLGLSELVSHSFNFRITPFNNVSSSHGDDRIPQKFPKSLIQQTFSFQINATAIVSFPELVKSRTIVFRSTDSSDKDFFVYNPTQHSLQVQVIPPLYQSMNSHPLIPSTPFTIISDLAPAIIPPFSQRLMARVRFNSSFVMSNSSKHVNGWFSDIFTLRNNLSFPIAINLKGRLFSPRINFIDPSNYLIVSKIEINLNETMPSCFDNVGISSSGKTIFIRATSAWNSSKLFSCFPSFSKTLLMSNRGDATLNVSRITASWVDSKVQDAYEKKTNLTVSQFFPLTLNPGESFPLKFSFQRIASLEEDFLLDLCFSSSVLIEFHVFLGDTKVNCLPLSCSLPKGFKGLVRGLRPVNFVVYFFRFCCVFLLVSSCIAISWDIFLLGIHSFQSSDVKNISIPAYSGLNDLLTFLKKPLLNLEKRLQINSVSHFPRSVSNKHSKKRSKMNLQEDLTLSDFKQKSTMNSSKTAFVPNEPQVSNNLSDYAIDGDTVDNACQLETEVMEDSVEECLISSLQDDRKCIGQHVNQPQSDATESANFLEEKSVCFNKIAVEEINLLPNPVFSESKSSVPELTDQEVKPGEEDRSQNGRRSHSFSSVMGVKKDLSPSKLDRSYSLGDDVPDPIASVVNSLFDDSSSNYSAIPGSQTSRIFLVQSFRSHPDISSVESTRKSPQSNTSTWGFPSSVSVCNSNFSVPNTMLPCLDSTTNYDQFRSLNSFGGNSSCGPSPYRRFSRSGDIYVHNRSNDFGIIGQSRRTHSIFPRQLEIVDDIASTSHHLNLGSVVHNAPRPSSPPPHSYVRNFTEFKN